MRQEHSDNGAARLGYNTRTFDYFSNIPRQFPLQLSVVLQGELVICPRCKKEEAGGKRNQLFCRYDYIPYRNVMH